MARMIPSQISPEIKSNAERKIFEWFRDDPQTDGWVVLHSLGIANHKTLMYGELDFVVIAPKLGVFGIEVKGGRVRREEGIWYFTNRYGMVSNKKRGPFEQANEGIFSVFDSVKKRCGMNNYLSRLLFGTGVMFPDIVFEASDMDGEQWQIFDQNDGRNISAFIRRLSKNTKAKWEKLYGPLHAEQLPDMKAVKALSDLLRGDFDKVVSIKTQMDYIEEELISLTEEQLRCLDQLEDNPRCLIEGPAGTGKTLLALEDVKKSALRGERVALFCFNAMLGNWLKEYFNKTSEEMRPAYVGTFHSFLYKAAGHIAHDQGELEFSDMQRFYREELPLIAYEVLEIKSVSFDRIVVDEAQDLITDEYLDIMELILKGGISRGRWSMFGDFSMQAIFTDTRNSDELKEMLEQKTAFIKYKLRINCRNTKPIGEEIKCLTGFDSTAFLKIEGPPVNYFTYSDDEEQKEKLQKLLDKLMKEKVEPELITILSPVRKDLSIVSTMDKYKITDYKPDLKNYITFSTIQAFKGLENTIIILTDIENFKYEKLMYVGLSRARAGLYIFETELAEKERKKLLARWI